MQKLQDRIALVSGAGRGIGRCVAEKLASEGARLVVNDVDEDAVMETVAALQATGATSLPCVGNVTDGDLAQRFVATAVDNWGPPDIIVNNAGYTWDGVIQNMTDEQFQDILDVHLVAPFRIMRAAAGPIREAARREASEGREVYRKVVNISSTSGIYGTAGQVNYSAAKAGVVGLTKAMAREWGRYKVNVNAVAFGLVHTRLTEPRDTLAPSIHMAGRDIPVGLPRAKLDSVASLLALGRGASAVEAAGAVYLLCIPESNYITGHVLMCDGGR